MKKYSYVLTYACILYISVMGLFGCKECRKGQREHITYDRFCDNYKGIMRFEGNEKLSFLKNGKDTVFFNGEGLLVYNEHMLLPRGNCEADFDFLHHKATFNSKMEGNLVFHYFTSGDDGGDTYEIMYQDKPLIKPIDVAQMSLLPFDTSLVLGRRYHRIRRFSPDSIDSVYLNNADADSPKYRIVRMKVNDNTYEVIP